jgi:hypothetical protein
MRPSRVAALAAALVALCACGGPSSPGHSSRTTKPTVSSCKFTADNVKPRHIPMIRLQPPNSSQSHVIQAIEPVMCGSIISAADYGTADLKFGSQAACLLEQDNAAGGEVTKLYSRSPVTAFFTLSDGEVSCVMLASHEHVDLCGTGLLLLDGTPVQVQATCDSDPAFQVKVLAGSLSVIDPDHHRYELGEGADLVFDFSIGRSIVGAAEFSSADVDIFRALAEEMDQPMVSAPQVITFTSTAPASPVPGGTYNVTATGGDSGNPVTFSIDPVSIKVCSISGALVTFTSTGTCTIDASQAGTAQFLPAPQAQQSITVVSPIQ